MPDEEVEKEQGQEEGAEKEEQAATEADKKFYEFSEFTPEEYADMKPEAQTKARRMFEKHRVYVQHAENDQGAMITHNKGLEAALERLSSATTKLTEREIEKEGDSITQEISRMEATAKTLKSERKEARAEGNWNRVDEIDEDLKKIERNVERKQDEAERKAAEDKKKKDEPKGPKVDPEVQKHIVKNMTWFLKDHPKYNRKMANMAIGLEAAYRMDPEWTDKDPVEFVKDIQKEVEKYFKYGDNSGGHSPAGAVEGVGAERRPGAGKEREKPLTASQIRVVQNYFLEGCGGDMAKATKKYRDQQAAIARGEH